MSCCPADSEPARAAATHTSSTITVGKTTIYRAGPQTAKIGLLAFPDIFGLDSGRSKQDADRLGELGYAVAFVDVADGDYPNDGDDKAAWVKTQDFDTGIMPRIHEAINHLKTEAKVETIVSYGYCYGGWVGARLSAETNNVVKGNVSFHPSWIVESILMGDGAIEKLAEKVNAPQLLLSSSNEPDSLKEGGSVQKILSARENVGQLSRVVDFPDVKHGWVNRGDIQVPTVKHNVGKAWELAREFIETVTA